MNSETSKRIAAGETIKVSLCRVRLNQGGYDADGRYFGVTSEALYLASWEGCESHDHIYLRGYTRDIVKEKVQKYLSGKAKFYR
jgi:hypothetical protein